MSLKTVTPLSFLKATTTGVDLVNVSTYFFKVDSGSLGFKFEEHFLHIFRYFSPYEDISYVLISLNLLFTHVSVINFQSLREVHKLNLRSKSSLS
jgi:hypothetical protein